jgi:trans-aconitate methyltransferase
MYPCDEAEKDRLDIYHHIFIVARGRDQYGRERLHKAPIPDNARILDLGTGTGIWPMQMAERYVNAEIVGTDIVNIQPPLIHVNLRFKVPQDFESPWQLGGDPWDFIHFRMGCGSVSNWPAMYEKIFAYLKPGGWLEHIEIDLRPQYAPGANNSRMLDEWYEYLDGATSRIHKRLEYPQNLRELLTNAGFVDIEEEVIRLPLNEWPEDESQKFIGRWYNLGLIQALEALTLGPLSRSYEWPLENIRQLLTAVKPHICSRRVRAYNELCVLTIS